MIINVGSKSPTKIQAVTETIKLYDFLKDSKIIPIETRPGISNQPKTLEETVRGAQNRATNSFQTCDYSIGIESGIMPVPYTLTGYMNFCACCVYDGKRKYTGLSPAFEFPPEVTERILNKNEEASIAFKNSSLTDKEKLGAHGAIGFLTNGKFRREDKIIIALQMALVQLENPELY